MEEDRNGISGLQNTAAQGSELYFFLCGFMGRRHISCTLNFLQARTEAGFRRTYSEDWTPQLGMCHRCTQGPASSPSAALLPCPALHPSRSRRHTLLWGHILLSASGSPEVEVSVLFPCQGPVRRPLGVATGRGMLKEKSLVSPGDERFRFLKQLNPLQVHSNQSMFSRTAERWGASHAGNRESLQKGATRSLWKTSQTSDYLDCI